MSNNNSQGGLQVVVPAAADWEVDALERVLSEAHGHEPDGYWRALAAAGLEAVKDEQLRRVLRTIDAEIDACDRALVGLHQIRDERYDRALGEGRL